MIGYTFQAENKHKQASQHAGHFGKVPASESILWQQVIENIVVDVIHCHVQLCLTKTPEFSDPRWRPA